MSFSACRFVLIVSLAVGLIFALAACGGGTSAAHSALPTTYAIAPVESSTQPLVIAPTSAAIQPAAIAAIPQPAATEPALPTEQPLAPEQSPPGDIPDNQAFVTYTASPGGYMLDAPEGWARTVSAGNVRFVNKLDGMSVTLTAAQAAPTATSARDHEVAALAKAGRAVTVGDIKDVQLPGGAAVLVTSTANSDPDPVTNKQVRLEQNTYLFFKDGTLATLNLWAPLGADNVDQWKRIAESFRWS